MNENITVLSNILDIITVDQLRRMTYELRKIHDNISSFINRASVIIRSLQHNTQQLRSYALAFWELQSLESDESFCECVGIFLT